MSNEKMSAKSFIVLDWYGPDRHGIYCKPTTRPMTEEEAIHYKQSIDEWMTIPENAEKRRRDNALRSDFSDDTLA